MGSIAYVTTKPSHLQSGGFDFIDCDRGGNLAEPLVRERALASAILLFAIDTSIRSNDERLRETVLFLTSPWFLMPICDIGLSSDQLNMLAAEWHRIAVYKSMVCTNHELKESSVTVCIVISFVLTTFAFYFACCSEQYCCSHEPSLVTSEKSFTDPLNDKSAHNGDPDGKLKWMFHTLRVYDVIK